MESPIGPKCFLSFSIFTLTVLSVYGVVGVVVNIFNSGKLLDLGEWPFNPHPVLYAFIGIQGLFPIAGLFAILAVWKKNPLFIYGSGSVLLGVFTCACVFGSVAHGVTITEIIDEFYNSLKKHSKNEEMLTWMNDIQWKHKCCGVYSYADYWSIKFDESVVPFEGVPSSCCRREDNVPHASCGEGILSRELKISPAEEKIYILGCGKTVAEKLRENLQRIGVEIWSLGGVSLLVAIFLYAGITKIFLKPTPIGIHPNERTDTCARSNGGRGRVFESNGISNNGSGLRGSVIDQTNNNTSASGSNFRQSSSNKLGIARPKMTRRQKAQPTKFGYGFSQGRSFNSAPLRRDINASKSFILGEAHSHLMSDTEGNNDKAILCKNVDMLWYQSLEKNVSTLSTTPNDISSFNFPNVHNKKPFMSSELMNAISEEERNTVYTLVSERPFTPSLSQNCSISFFNNYPIKVSTTNGTAEPTAMGLTTPQFSNSKQQRPIHGHPMRGEDEAPIIVEEEEEIKDPIIDLEQAENQSCITIPSKPISDNDAQNDNNVDDVASNDENGSNESLILQMNAVGSIPPATASAVKYPISSVRSSTLATIQEESESSKGSPVNANKKGSSPASGYMSPANVSPRQTETELHSPGNNDDIDLKTDATPELSSADKIGEAISRISNLDTDAAASSSPIFSLTAINNENTSIPIRVGQQEFTETISEECAKYLDVDPNMNSKDSLIPSPERRNLNMS